MKIIQQLKQKRQIFPESKIHYTKKKNKNSSVGDDKGLRASLVKATAV